MKFTLSWLKQFIELGANGLNEVVAALTNLGMEVEGVHPQPASLSGFIIGEVIECSKHPNADSLNVCQVVSGHNAHTLQVICGAANVRAGLKVIFAPIGATVPSNGMQISKRKLRGIESEGMICSAAELCLGEDDGTIAELDSSLQVGKRFIDACPWAADPTIEIAVTPNRPDWLGVYGIARDLAAYGLGRLKQPAEVDQNLLHEDTAIPCPISISIADESACPVFTALYISGIDNSKPTNLRLRTLLQRAGIKSISPVVDITNYINLSFNRPMHAYDADKLAGNKLEVRFKKHGECMIPLGGDEIAALILKENDLVVADAEKVCALAGVIGDARSKCTPQTTNVLLEAAVFRADLIYKTGRKHAINTDSRYRFERGVDQNFTTTGMGIAAQMVLAGCGGTASQPAVAGTTEAVLRTLSFDTEKVASLTGVELSVAKMIEILNGLGFECQLANGNGRTVASQTLNVIVPSWRNDVTITEDLVEEIIRVHGYDNIPMQPMPLIEQETAGGGLGFSLRSVPLPAINIVTRDIRALLAAIGYDELMTWSFMSSKTAERFNLLEQSLGLINPISAELDVMRHSLLPNLLDCVAKNNARSFQNLSFFEIGDIFDKSGKQTRMICGVRSGKTAERNIHGAGEEFGFFDAKADVMSLLSEVFGLDEAEVMFAPISHGDCHVAASPVTLLAMTCSVAIRHHYHPSKSTTVLVHGQPIGWLGELHPNTTKASGISLATIAFEINLSALEQLNLHKSSHVQAFTPSDYQPVSRDFAFVMDKSTSAQQLVRAIHSAHDDQQLIKTVSIFDVFEGGHGLEPNQKSIAVNVVMQSQDHSLTTDEITKASEKIVAAVQSRIDGARLRI